MIRNMVVPVTALLLLTACAAFPVSAQTISPTQKSLVDAACAKVMGLRQGESYWFDCEDSLSQSLALRTKALSTEQSYEDCRKGGLTEGSPAFATCVLDKQNSAQPVPEPVSSRIASSAQPVKLAYDASSKSYWNMTPTEHWRQEQYSCAQLGFAPYQGGFTHCVASLDAALWPDPN